MRSKNFYMFVLLAMLSICCLNAEKIEVGQSIQDYLPPGEILIYQLTITEDSVYVIYTKGTTNVIGSIYKSGEEIAVDDNSGEGSNCRIEIPLLVGDYEIRIKGRLSNTKGSFSLRIEGKNHGILDDLGGFSIYSADNIFSGNIVLTKLRSKGGDRDYFRLNVENAGLFVIFAIGANVKIEIYDELYNKVFLGQDEMTVGINGNPRIEKRFLPGTYYIMVKGRLSNTSGNYGLHIETINKPTYTDRGGYSYWSAEKVYLKEFLSIQRSLDVKGDQDFFKFEVKKGANYQIISSEKNLKLHIYNRNFSLVANNKGGKKIKSILVPGTYYLKVHGLLNNTTGDYNVIIQNMSRMR